MEQKIPTHHSEFRCFLLGVTNQTNYTSNQTGSPFQSKTHRKQFPKEVRKAFTPWITRIHAFRRFDNGWKSWVQLSGSDRGLRPSGVTKPGLRPSCAVIGSTEGGFNWGVDVDAICPLTWSSPPPPPTRGVYWGIDHPVNLDSPCITDLGRGSVHGGGGSVNGIGSFVLIKTKVSSACGCCWLGYLDLKFIFFI